MIPLLEQRRRASFLLDRLGDHFGVGLRSALRYENPFQFLVAVILSARCTDEQVNRATKKLFLEYPDFSAFTRLDESRLKSFIKTCGLFNNKAKNILALVSILQSKHGGRVPETFEALVELPGVGRKTAAVVSSELFAGDVIAVDTHVHRCANRLGLAAAATPEKTADQLMKVIPAGRRREAHHALIRLGRSCCRARKPACAACPVGESCPAAVSFFSLSPEAGRF